SYDHLFTACGTGTTLAGIVKGIAGRKLSAVPEGVAVLKGASFLGKDIREAAGSNLPFRLHTDRHLGGYAKSPPGFLRWLSDFHRRHGILLDPVYTGKMMHAVFSL